MSAGQGSLSFTNNQNNNANALNGANNGLDVDANKAVLGQDPGEAGNPAALINNREVPLNSKVLNFLGASLVVTFDDTNQVFTVADQTGKRFLLVDILNKDFRFGDIDGAQNGMVVILADFINQIFMGPSQGNLNFNMDYTNDITNLFCPTGGVGIQMDGINGSLNLQNPNGITTDAPNGAPGAWRLGQKIAGAVAFDNANYVEVNISGVVYKLALAV